MLGREIGSLLNEETSVVFTVLFGPIVIAFQSVCGWVCLVHVCVCVRVYTFLFSLRVSLLSVFSFVLRLLLSLLFVVILVSRFVDVCFTRSGQVSI